MAKNRNWWLLAIYVFLSVYMLPMFPHGGSDNEITRWATSASLVEKGSFEISWTESLTGRNVDTAVVGNKIYSNKAPGPALLGAPIYALTRLFAGPPDASNIRISWFAMRFVISTLPLLLLAYWLSRRGADEFAIASLLFATPLFVYSLLLFSHILVAVLIYTAFRLLFDEGSTSRRCLLAGLASGFAVISEFPALFPVAVFGVGLLLAARTEKAKLFGAFVAGGIPSILFLLAYNNSLFGSPLSMSYAHESFPEWAEVASRGVFGIGFPSVENLYLLLISPARGLFFTAPILLLSIYAAIRGGVRTSRENVKYSAILLTTIIVAGHGAAHGGWAFGPRYLILVIPFLLDSLFERKFDDVPVSIRGLLFGASIILCILPSLTFPFAPPEFTFPHRDFWAAFLLRENWFVPNLANVFGVPSKAITLIPVFIGLLTAVLLVARSIKNPARFFAGMGAAGAILSVYLIAPSASADAESSFRRASIAERYFRTANRLESFKTAAVNSNDAAAVNRIRQTEMMIAEVRAFAPNDFPYSSGPLQPSPRMVITYAASLQKQGKTDQAVTLIRSSIDKFDFARCEMSTNLAVMLYSSGKKQEAFRELESIQPLVSQASSPDCMRSQYLYAALAAETGQVETARLAYEDFLKNSAQSKDPAIVDLRKSVPQQ